MNLKPISNFSVSVTDRNFRTKAIMLVRATSKANAFFIVSNMLKGSTATPSERSIKTFG